MADRLCQAALDDVYNHQKDLLPVGGQTTSADLRSFAVRYVSARLLVSTAGFTEPAILAIENSRYHIIRWDINDLVEVSRGIATRQFDVSFEVPDQAFWDEVIGST